jgi:cation diffusion facilitator family transporter
MKNFPKPVIPPLSVPLARAIRKKQILQSAKIGLFIRLGIIAFEIFGVWLYGSSALLLDALSSLIDVASTLLLIFFVKIAARPPDEDHPFGHGRYEPIIGLQLGILLIVFGIGIAVQQLFLASQTTTEAIDPRTWIFPVIAVILLEITYRIVMRTAKIQQSPALIADALHYRIDSIASFLAAIALISGTFLPEWSQFLDHMGAVSISIFMVWMGLYAARSNLNQLMDKVPETEFFNVVRKAAKKVDGVKETEKIRIQYYGPDAHVDIDIEVEPKLTVEVAHKISQKVRVEIQKEWPSVRDVTVHIEPYYKDDH